MCSWWDPGFLAMCCWCLCGDRLCKCARVDVSSRGTAMRLCSNVSQGENRCLPISRESQTSGRRIAYSWWESLCESSLISPADVRVEVWVWFSRVIIREFEIALHDRNKLLVAMRILRLSLHVFSWWFSPFASRSCPVVESVLWMLNLGRCKGPLVSPLTAMWGCPTTSLSDCATHCCRMTGIAG